jgi:hypothetical protein
MPRGHAPYTPAPFAQGTIGKLHHHYTDMDKFLTGHYYPGGTVIRMHRRSVPT